MITDASTTAAIRVVQNTMTMKSRQWHSPSNCVPGSARSMKVRTSLPGPKETFVTTGDARAARETVYGMTPPVTVSPQGSQVLIVVETLAWTTGGLFGV